MITKEWCCAAHGDFEGPSLNDGPPKCPHGCNPGMVQRIFRTAPAIQSASYRGINRTFETLAREHGLTDMSNRGGDGMRRADAGAHKRLRTATEMVMNHTRSGLTGQDAGQFFKPLNEFNPGSSRGGVLQKETTRTVTDSQGREHTFGTGRTLINGGPGMAPQALPTPGVVLDRPAFDGRELGVPDTDR